MKHSIRTGKKVLAVFLATVLVALTASMAAVAESVDVLVRFVNDYATESINPGTDLTVYKPGTVLEYHSVQNGAEVDYEGNVPTRRKDADFGKYNFAGWVTRDDEGNETPVALPFTATQDTTLYATFTGEEITCEIDFRSDGVYVDADGKLQPDLIRVPVLDESGEPKRDPLDDSIIYTTKVNDATLVKISVPYGGSVTPPANDPERPEQEHYTFTFKGWDYDCDHIYKSGSINAEYNIQGKTFTFEFCDYDGTSLGKRQVVYGEAVTDVPEVAEREFSTNESNYSFHDQWNVKQDGLQTDSGEVINLERVMFNTVSPDENGVIKVYAQYWQQLKEYFFSLRIIDDDGEPAEGVGVQVTGSENQLLTTFTDKDLGHNGGVGTTDEDGWVNLSVPYQEKYTISAYDPYYNLAVQKEFSLYDLENNAQITLQLSAPYDLNNGQQYCNDVCHSFIGGLWITGLNLFYRLFKVKYVCCYDMYATHGDRLVYASNSSGTTIDRS